MTWPGPGAPELAEAVYELLASTGSRPEDDASRGYGHGTFIPLMLAYPQADIPVVQVSLKRGLDPVEHTELGTALAPLCDSMLGCERRARSAVKTISPRRRTHQERRRAKKRFHRSRKSGTL